MPKIEKVKVNVKEKVEDNVCDLSLSELSEVPVREIVSKTQRKSLIIILLLKKNEKAFRKKIKYRKLKL